MALITRFKTVSLPSEELVGFRKVEESLDKESEIICIDDIIRAAFVAPTFDNTHHAPPGTARTRKLKTDVPRKTHFVVDLIDTDLFIRLHVHNPELVH